MGATNIIELTDKEQSDLEQYWKNSWALTPKEEKSFKKLLSKCSAILKQVKQEFDNLSKNYLDKEIIEFYRNYWVYYTDRKRRKLTVRDGGRFLSFIEKALTNTLEVEGSENFGCIAHKEYPNKCFFFERFQINGDDWILCNWLDKSHYHYFYPTIISHWENSDTTMNGIRFSDLSETDKNKLTKLI